MTKKTEVENKVAVKQTLALKYRQKAERTPSVPAKARLIRRSERYTRQANAIKKTLAK